jgi:hypothetical protein
VTVGLTSTQANAFLNVYRNTAASAVATPFIKLHTGDPGSAGTSNASAVTTRNAITWSAASGGSMALSSLSSFSMTTSETISHISIWDASTSGNFLQSCALTASVPVINGSTLSFSAVTIAMSPIAA